MPHSQFLENLVTTLFNILHFLRQLSGDGTTDINIRFDAAGEDGLRDLLQMLADMSFAAYDEAFCARSILQKEADHE